MKTIIINSLVYFGIVFSIGLLLGTIRVLVLLPWLGERLAELLEMPVMLVAIVYSARYLVFHLSPQASARSLLYVGLLALLLLLGFEFTLVLAIRGISIAEYIASRDPVSGSAYAISLILYALMPYLLARIRARQGFH